MRLLGPHERCTQCIHCKFTAPPVIQPLITSCVHHYGITNTSLYKVGCGCNIHHLHIYDGRVRANQGVLQCYGDVYPIESSQVEWPPMKIKNDQPIPLPRASIDDFGKITLPPFTMTPSTISTFLTNHFRNDTRTPLELEAMTRWMTLKHKIVQNAPWAPPSAPPFDIAEFASIADNLFFAGLLGTPSDKEQTSLTRFRWVDISGQGMPVHGYTGPFAPSNGSKGTSKNDPAVEISIDVTAPFNRPVGRRLQVNSVQTSDGIPGPQALHIATILHECVHAIIQLYGCTCSACDICIHNVSQGRGCTQHGPAFQLLFDAVVERATPLGFFGIHFNIDELRAHSECGHELMRILRFRNDGILDFNTVWGKMKATRAACVNAFWGC